MAYINFEEEIYAANKQRVNRVNNNNKLIKELSDNFNIKTLTPWSKYSFRKIENRTLFSSKVCNEEEFVEIRDKDIVCVEFINCKIWSVKFVNCNFIGCIFTDCDLSGGGVIFENCNFLQHESLDTPSLNKRVNLSCEFQNCNIYAKFSNSTVSYIMFNYCNICNTNFERSKMDNSIFNTCELDTIIFSDVDLSGARFVKCYYKNLDFNDEYKTIFDEQTFFDKIIPLKKDKGEYEGIYKVYQSIANKFQENNLKNNFGEYYYLCRVAQRKSLKLFQRIISFIEWLIIGYGERIINILLTSMGIMLFFSIIYLIVGIKIDEEVVSYISGMGIPNGFFEFLRDFNKSLNLSIGVFVCGEVFDCSPIEKWYFLADIEMILGVIFIGLGIATITRKVIR